MYKLLYFIKAKTLINEKHEILKGAQNKLQIQLTWEQNPFMINIQKIRFSYS